MGCLMIRHQLNADRFWLKPDAYRYNDAGLKPYELLQLIYRELRFKT